MACKRVNTDRDRDRELDMLEVFPKAKSLFATLGIH